MSMVFRGDWGRVFELGVRVRGGRVESIGVLLFVGRVGVFLWSLGVRWMSGWMDGVFQYVPGHSLC